MVAIRLTDYKSEHFLHSSKEETLMHKMKYDPVSNSFIETEGWRSWAITTTLVQYLTTLIYIVGIGVVWYILVFGGLFIGLVIAMVMGYRPGG